MTSSFTADDERAMQRALQLAALATNSAHPNPRVGCVLVAGGEVVGEGWHRRAGEPHAEVFALRAAGARARGATAYVSLEPCNHVGRTPPCTEALLKAGVSRVIFAMRDPDPRVDGSGAEHLRRAGVKVESGLLGNEARELNLGFVSRVQRSRPWVRLKLAASLDGRTALANGESRWITSEAARQDVQLWRARSDAIMTGVGTVLADDPELTLRVGAEPRRQPLRVVLDSNLRTPSSAKLLHAAGETLLLTTVSQRVTPHAPTSQRPTTSPLGKWPAGVTVEVVSADASGRVALQPALARLGKLPINELWVEAGATLAGALLSAALVDELVLYYAPKLLGQDARPLVDLNSPLSLSSAIGFQLHSVATLGGDVRLVLRTPGAV